MMRGLTKLFSHTDKILDAFFLRFLPGLLKLIILTICMLWKYYKLISIKHEYMSAISKRSSRFYYCRKSRPKPVECAVCLSEIEEGEEGMELGDCKHAFHKSCLEKWLIGYKATCPLCRNRVVPEEVVAEYERVQAEDGDGWIEKELALVLINALDGRSCNGIFN